MARTSIGRIALFSIRPHFASAIFRGEKLVELRRKPISHDVTHIVVYATAPVRAVIGWFEVDGIEQGSKSQIWERHGSAAWISRREYRDYYSGTGNAVAIRVANAQELSSPFPIDAIPGVLRAPQSFQYIDSDSVPQLFEQRGRRPKIHSSGNPARFIVMSHPASTLQTKVSFVRVTKRGRTAMAKRGLDNRAENKNGRIREKNGAAKVKNLEGDYPVLGKLFGPEQTLTDIKRKYKVDSLDEALKVARKDVRK